MRGPTSTTLLAAAPDVPKAVDTTLAGLGLFTSVALLGALEPLVKQKLFSPPMLASGIIFFLPAKPPSPYGFLMGTLWSATITMLLTKLLANKIPALAMAGVAGGSLLMWCVAGAQFYRSRLPTPSLCRPPSQRSVTQLWRIALVARSNHLARTGLGTRQPAASSRRLPSWPGFFPRRARPASRTPRSSPSHGSRDTLSCTVAPCCSRICACTSRRWSPPSSLKCGIGRALGTWGTCRAV